ncbi:glycosyltransferase family 4 protein [Mucilaginibacter defluvii]|uniref:Glycosyltransferase family 4 protein n=1 Tax=Mucilaginibacter defluvii TaxID=1196019 RepID=A0ABP9FK14_9SPHI
MKKRIAFIVQRYGEEVNGGAEYHCRILAEKLTDDFDVQVLTSCAKDYMSWANEYPAGESYLNNVKIIRFPVKQMRDFVRFGLLNKKLNKRNKRKKWLSAIKMLPAYDRFFHSFYERKWIDEQGPFMPELLGYLKSRYDNFDAFIFFTYLYYPTAKGLELVKDKAIFIPTAHDEPPIYMHLFRRLFKQPKAILYNTPSEQKFVNNLFKNTDIYADIVGVGITEKQVPFVANEHHHLVNSGYLIYIGRIETSKQCDVLAQHFVNYKIQNQNNLKLVFVGRAFMELVQHPDIIYTGFVSEELKLSLLCNARALIIPSIYESLSLVTLESMAQGIPVIANERSEVLKDHINNSQAGFLYHDQQSFNKALDVAINPALDRKQLSLNAKQYVAENYTWPVVINKFIKAVDYVVKSNRH